MYNREEILNKLDKLDKPYKFEKFNSTPHFNSKSQYEDLYNIVLWLQKELNLKYLEMELRDNKNNKNITKNISARQYLIYNAALSHLLNNRLDYSYHEICDFIRDSHLVKNEPFTIIEKTLLSIWVKMFIEKYNNQ